MEFLIHSCRLMVLNRELLSSCKPFRCGDDNEGKPLHFYEKNHFSYLYSSESQEAETIHMPLPLKTRFMFFDLIDLQTE